MTIIFLCGGLERGSNGVGDYTRKIAAELITQNQRASIIALFDKDIEECFEETQNEGDVIVPVLRIPFNFRNLDRVKASKQFINLRRPQWLSLQFVPFSFNNKGLPFNLASCLSELGKGSNWNIMFHELWLGMEVNSSYKMLFWGWVQKQIIFHLIKKLQPKVIYTQTQLYKFYLSKLGVDVKFLPLFGNVEKLHISRADLRTDCFTSSNSSKISFVIFGNIHYGASVEQFAKEIVAYEKTQNRGIEISFVGRCGVELEHWVKVCKKEGISLKVFGEQSVENISTILSSATIGISTTPLELIEKSGTVAAMREHNLPVVCVSRNWTARGKFRFDMPEGVLEYKVGKLTDTLQLAEPTSPVNSASTIAKIFASSLKKNNSGSKVNY